MDRKKMSGCLLLCMVLWGVARWCHGQKVTFHSDYMRAAVEKLRIGSMADTLRTGYTTLKVKGRRVGLNINRERQVDYIGMPLFDRRMKALQPSPVYNYLEYALLDRVFGVSENPFANKDLKCVEGKWSDWEKVTEKTPVIIDNHEDKVYEVTWTLGAAKKLRLRFPLKYDMMANSSRKELTANFVRDLGKEANRPGVKTGNADICPAIDDMELSADGMFYVRRAGHYLQKGINGDTYYRKTAGGKARLLYDRRYPMESMANMFLSEDSTYKKRVLQMDVVRDDFRKESVRCNIYQLMQLAGRQGCRPYFGLAEADDEAYECWLYLCNTAAGYVHLFRLTGLTKAAVSYRPMQVKAYLYLPTANIRNVLNDNITNRNKKTDE